MRGTCQSKQCFARPAGCHDSLLDRSCKRTCSTSQWEVASVLSKLRTSGLTKRPHALRDSGLCIADGFLGPQIQVECRSPSKARYLDSQRLRHSLLGSLARRTSSVKVPACIDMIPNEDHCTLTAAGKHDVVTQCYWQAVNMTSTTLPPPSKYVGIHQ
jgi:hypothetical protein